MKTRIPAWNSLLPLFLLLLPDATAAETSNADAVSGTWVLQQVDDPQELTALLPKTIAPALDTPHIRGFSLRFGWRIAERDLSLLWG
jgi:hypothetical protein